MASLAEFAVNHRPVHTGVSWLTTIPEHDEVVTAWGNGVPVGTIRRWLMDEKGYAQSDLTESRVGGYLRRVHPR